MRVTAALMTVLCTGVLSQVLADEPQAPPASPAPAAPAAAAQGNSPPPAAEPPAAAQSATPPAAQPSVVKPGITVTSAKAELTPPEKELLSRGYKLEIRHGEKYFCHTETPIDSRFPVKNCDTAESIEAHRESGQQAARDIQNNRPQIGR
jgi:hypothetical protein